MRRRPRARSDFYIALMTGCICWQLAYGLARLAGSCTWSLRRIATPAILRWSRC